MKNQLSFIFFLALFLFHPPSYSQRIGLSNEEWKTIKTEHFDIVFTAKQQDLGLYYANEAEKAYENLATVFINKPDRVVIIVNDTTDISNGYATRIPYAHIMAYAVPIDSQESLSEAGDWGRELITHELTHIMQFEPALGLYKFIRPIFGTIVAPNLLMPLWWKEGMAVEMETEFSPKGRSRSLYQDASVRAFVLDHKLFDYTLPQENEILPSWPYGARPYLFGSLFWSSFVHDSNLGAVNKIVSRQGERVPYAIEEPMQEVVHRTYNEQYLKALNEAEQNAATQIETLNNQSLSEVQPVKLHGQNSFAPRWSENFKILAFIEQIESKSEITFINEKNQRLSLKNRPTGTLNSLDFHPTAKKILYSKVDDFNSKYKISDLYIYDLSSQKSDRITLGQRARDASFSEDGQKVIFISTFSGRTQIRMVDPETKKIETLISSNFKERFQSPIFWNKNEILYSKISENGSEKLYKMNLSDKKEILVNLNLPSIRFLRKKKWDNHEALYFTSAQNGVNNIYVSMDLKTAFPVTHVPTGIWSFDIDPINKKVWSTNMTSNGFQVGSVEIKKLEKLPVIENKLAERYTFVDRKTPDKTYSSEDYTAGHYLWPTYWIPYIASSSSSKGVYVQAQTSGHDPINVHEYSLQANYDTELQKGGFLGYYINSTLSIPFQLAANIHNQALGDVTNIVETKTASLGLLPDVFKINKNLTFQIGAEYQQTNYFSEQTEHWGPYFLVNYLNYAQNIFQISPENGWGAYLKYENMHNVKDSRDYNKVLASAIGYFSPWLPKHHTFMTRVSALMTFETIPARFGTSNNSLFDNSDLALPQFVLRGYTPSQFYGRSLCSANIEYRFPLVTLNAGSGTDPYFLKRISGALTTDGLAVEGGSITAQNEFEKRSLSETFWSSGLEFKLETTIGYVLPMNFVLGAYVPHSQKFSSSPQIGFSFQIGGF